MHAWGGDVERSYEMKAGTLADGLAVPVVGTNAFNVARRFVDSTCQVSEGLISLAVLRCLELEKMIIEGGGVVGLAAILPGGPLFRAFSGKRVVIPLW
jgi:threonine dehydratase